MLRGAFIFIASFVLLMVITSWAGLTVGPYELLLAVALAAGVAVMLTHRSRTS
ncbi:MAG: hypothetical protein QOG93_841 [Gaiellaceae bacterium]|nr:hypothetical protein [Gaiellaceae bacterium]MDX6436804.1 hypothetical protein [Gaiellaceae bacterium]